MSINTRLSDLLDYILEVQLNINQELSEKEMARAGTYDTWSIKDNLAHNADWASHHLAELETIERGEAWPERNDGAFEDENRAIFDKYERISWDELLAMLHDTYGRGQAYLGRISEDGLLAPLPDDPKRTVWRYLAGEFVMHPMAHVWGYLVQNDHSDLIEVWFGEWFTEQLLAVSDDSGWQGTMLYNQAYFLALAGKTDKAISQLAEALALEPGLTEWSKEDVDLESLRDEAAYQALYELE